MIRNVRVRELLIAVVGAFLSAGVLVEDSARSAPLAPNDASIVGNLSVWLRDAPTNYDGTTWTDLSGNGNHASAAGLLPSGDAGGVTFSAPALSSFTESAGPFAGLNVAGVRFSGGADDLLRATNLNGGSSIGNATTIIVYASPGTPNIQRVVGLGSIHTESTGVLDNRPVVFNPADDGSVRYDWGQSGAGSLTRPTDQLFVRGTTLAATANPGEGTVNDYFDGLLNVNATTTPGGGGFPVEDALYVGDVRAGATTVYGSSTSNDLFVAEVIAYDTVLSQQQIADIGEWLGTNIAVTTLEEFPRLTINRATGSMSLENNTADAIDIVGYSITSAAGALDQANWTPITDNYDDAAGPGDGSVDPDDAWTVLTGAGVATDLSEGQFGGTGPQDGGTLGIGSSVDLGSGDGVTTSGPWVRNPLEDVQMQLKLADGTNIFPTVIFEGNGGEPLMEGDLDFDGAITASDWNIFKAGFDEDLSGLSLAQAYQMGDLDGDLDNDPFDFGLFKELYDAENGAGAFNAMISAAVPEPSTFVLIAALGLPILALRRVGKSRIAYRAVVAGLLVAVIGANCRVAHAVPLAPDDPSISGDLLVWLRDVRNNFDTGTGTWTDVSGNGNDAAAAGLTTSGVTFGAPILAEVSPTSGAFGALPSVSGVLFRGDEDDLLSAATINGGTALTDVTIITVYQSQAAANNIQRPAGIGSISSAVDLASRPVVFNQADDASLRYDYGSTGGTLPQPVDTLFVRASTLSGSTVNDFFDGTANINNGTGTPGGGGFPPTEDALYLGDVRAGATSQFNATATNDIFVAESIVYGTALTQQQVTDIGEWLQSNVAEFAFARPTLRVNTETGAMSLTNEFNEAIDIDLYRITGPADSLNPSGWNSLEDLQPNAGQDLGEFPRGDGNGSGWEELGSPDSDSLSEAFLLGSSLLGGGASISLGNAFDTSGPGEGSLTFEVRTAAGSVITGNIEYVTGGAVLGDYNGDGIVDAADYTVWRDNLGGDASAAFAAGTRDPDASGPISTDDYSFWRANFGNTFGSLDSETAAVPEPSSALLALFGILGLALFGAQGRAAMRLFPIRACVAAIVAWAVVGSAALATVTNDRVYQLGDDLDEDAANAPGGVVGTGPGNVAPGVTIDTGNPGDGSGSFIDLLPIGNPVYVDVGTLGSGRTGRGVSFDGVDDVLQGIPLNRPDEMAGPTPVGDGPLVSDYPFNYDGITARGAQMWVYAEQSEIGVSRQVILMDTVAAGGVAITADGNWTQINDGLTNDTDIPAATPVVGDQWHHVMHHVYPSDSAGAPRVVAGSDLGFTSVVYVNGIAVSANNGSPEPGDLTGGNRIGVVSVGAAELSDDGLTPVYGEFFSGAVDDLEMYVFGDNSASGGQDYGAFNLFTDNKWIAQEILDTVPGQILEPGDVNRDGVVNDDDIAPFVAGWLSENVLVGAARTVTVGDWNTWGDGDMDHNGITDLDDAFILHEALRAAGSAGLDFSLLTGSNVPEPATIALLAIGAATLLLRRYNRN